jgi:hypothetical protein
MENGWLFLEGDEPKVGMRAKLSFGLSHPCSAAGSREVTITGVDVENDRVNVEWSERRTLTEGHYTYHSDDGEDEDSDDGYGYGGLFGHRRFGGGPRRTWNHPTFETETHRKAVQLCRVKTGMVTRRNAELQDKLKLLQKSTDLFMTKVWVTPVGEDLPPLPEGGPKEH